MFISSTAISSNGSDTGSVASKGTLLYVYSLIIAKNFVTVYTAFDY